MAANPKDSERLEAARRELLERSEQFELAQEALGVATWIWEPASDRVQWYGDASRLLGLAPGSFSGRFEDYLACVHPDDAAGAKGIFVECLKGHLPSYRAVERVVWPDGSVHWLETYGRAEYGADGQALRMAGVIKDVTAAKGAESARVQSERMFGALFESSPEPIAIARQSDGVQLDVNEAWLRSTGYSREQAVGRSSLEIGLWVEPEARQAALAQLNAVGVVHNHPARFARADGQAIPVLLSGAKVVLDGEACVVWTWLDVAELSAALQHAQQAERKFASMFETSPVALVVSRAGPGPGLDDRIVEINDAALALIGVPREEAIGATAIELLTWAEPSAIEALRQRALAGERILGAPAPFDRRDGERVEALLSGVQLDIGAEPHFVISLHDITERKRHEAMLVNIARGVSAEVGDAFFQSLVSHLARDLGADLAFIAKLSHPGRDRFRTLAFVADGAIAPNFAYAVEGSPCATALARRGTVIYAAGVAELFPLDAGLTKHGVQGYVGTSLHGADGSPIGILVVMHRKPIERGQWWGSIIEIFGARAAAEIERASAERLVRRTNASLEQTVRERTAELEDANRDLESYNFSISHDLRQPLNAIAGFAELLRDAGTDAPPRQRREFLREIESNAERMDRMINALLQLARAGRGKLVKAPVDMRALVDSVLRELSVGAPLKAHVEIGELPPARGDADLLRQVWSNLIGNALKYSRGRRKPRVRLWGETRAGATEYAVSDNGVGFDMRHVERLFEAFHRLPSAASFEGSGVGLAIVQRIVRRHGGHLVPQSAPGEGATFRFTLPV